MVASFHTIEQVYMIMRRHCTDAQVEKIVDDLLQVPGNKSFRNTILRLAGRDAKEGGKQAIAAILQRHNERGKQNEDR